MNINTGSRPPAMVAPIPTCVPAGGPNTCRYCGVPCANAHCSWECARFDRQSETSWRRRADWIWDASKRVAS